MYRPKIYDLSGAWETVFGQSRRDYERQQKEEEEKKRARLAASLPANVNPEFAENHPLVTKGLDTLTDIMPLTNFLKNSSFAQRAGQTGGEIITTVDRPDKVSTGSKAGDISADLLGNLLGFAANPAGSAMNTGATLFNLGTKATGKVLPKTINPIARTAAEMGAGAVGYEGTRALLNQREINPLELGMAGAVNAGLGALTHGVARLPIKRTEVQNQAKIPLVPSKPRKLGELKAINQEQRALNEMQRGIENAQNHIMHNDILAAYPKGTTVKQAYADLKAKTGIDLPALVKKAETVKNVPLRQQLINDLDTTLYGQVAGVIPRGSEITIPRRVGNSSIKQTRTQMQPKEDLMYEGMSPEPIRVNEQAITNRQAAATVEPMPKHDPFLENVKDMATNWKDKAKPFLKRETMERNFEDIMGKDAPKMKEVFIEPIKKSETNRIKFLNNERSEIARLGIKARSKESELLQKYGEKDITLEELQQQAPKNYQKIIKAEKVLRQKYDQYISDINKVLVKNGYDPVKKRKDYFRHFEDVTSIVEQFGIPKSKIEDLPTDINGLSADFRPGKSFFANLLQRKGNKTTYDAITGIDGYLEGASKVIFHTDNVQRLRGLEKTIRSEFEGTKHLSNFAAELTEYTNILAGKKAMIDRAVEDVVGRGIYAVADTLRRRVGANMIGGNISSAFTNYIPLTQTLATTSKPAVIKAAKDTLSNVLKNDGFIDKSGFLTRRFGSDPLSLNMFQKAGDKLSWLFESIDRFVAQIVVRSKFNEGMNKGLKPEVAIKQADEWAGKLMADRSLGGLPTLFNSRSLGILTQFQVEVNNQFSFLMKDIPRAFDKTHAAAAVTQLFLYGYLYNIVFEKAAGYTPALDPIGITLEAYEDYTNENLKTTDANKNLIRNIAWDLPFTATIGGGRIPLTSAIPNPLAVARGESTALKETSKPLFGVLSPIGGGNQARKTYQGAKSLMEGGSYTDKGELKFPAGGTAQSLIFGPNASEGARDYYKNMRKPLTTEETEEVTSGKKSYKKVRSVKEIDKKIRAIDKEIKELAKNKGMGSSEKAQKINALRRKRAGLARQKRGN